MFEFQQSVNSSFEPSTKQPLDLCPLNRTFTPSRAPFEVLSATRGSAEAEHGEIVTIVAKWSYLEGKRDEAIAALRELANRVETHEPSVLMYTIHTANFDIQSFPIPSTNDIMFLSIFANKAAFEAHLRGPVFNNWLDENPGLS